MTCLSWPEVSASDLLLQEALERHGASVVGRPWNEPGASFGGFDAVILRSNWDYHFAPAAFTDWLARWEEAGARIWNPPALVRWNLSKAYLLELAAAGVPVVPTVILDDPARLLAVMTARDWATAVVKPLVSASGHDTILVPRREAPAVAEALAAGRIRQPAVVQPFVEEIQARGEWSLVFVDGAFTHAILKRAASGEFRVHPRYGGTSEARSPAAGTLAAARQALARLPTPALYARIDGVETDRGFVVMEVEVNEPGLFLIGAPAAAEALALAILRRLDGL